MLEALSDTCKSMDAVLKGPVNAVMNKGPDPLINLSFISPHQVFSKCLSVSYLLIGSLTVSFLFD